MENKRKHLEFIQTVISRMAQNLFFLKGWSITLIMALFALLPKDTDKKYMIVPYFLVLMFWILDGYFLSRERSFRGLYNHVRKLDEEKINFSMDISEYIKDKNTWICSIFSKTLLFFYAPLVSIMLIIMYLIN